MNKASNAPGFGNGSGTLKTPQLRKAAKKKIWLPSVTKKPY